MPTILCIDDQQRGLVIRKALLEGKGYSVLTASDGETGIKLVRTRLPDAVILDWRMPTMDGGQVAKFLKAKYPALPILLLTGSPRPLPAALLASVDGVIQKGEPVSVLLSALRALLTRHRAPKTRKGGGADPLIERFQPLSTSKTCVEQSLALLECSGQLLQRSHSNRTRRSDLPLPTSPC